MQLRRLLRKLIGTVSSTSPAAASDLIRESQEYWTNRDSRGFSANSHWRGAGPFEREGLWETLGRAHLDLAHRAKRWAGQGEDLGAIVEWGCGGGMNAVQFLPHADRYFGVEISSDSLDECRRQVGDESAGRFAPVLVEAAAPDQALEKIGTPCDFFLCTYVYELFPTPEYGLKVLEVANSLLRDGGLALIQVRYRTSETVAAGHANYADNLAQMTTYTVEEFWTAAEKRGFDPLFVRLLPKQPELREKDYAYFALQKTAR